MLTVIDPISLCSEKSRKSVKLKRVVLLFMLFSLLMMSMPTIAIASAQSAQVTIPSFPVLLNELDFSNNDYAQYPLLVFRGITYFPMTYYQSRLLNLETDWTAEGGLVIKKGNPDTPKEFKHETPTSSKNNSTQNATIVDIKVTVNGKVIDNKNEPYPLLLFRGITYFPLTWRFAVDEFGWSYHYDNNSGLRIKANNFFFISGADGSGYADASGTVVNEAETHYIKGNVRIFMKTSSSRAEAGPVSSNLSIFINDVERKPEGWFGYFRRQKAPLFTVEGGMIHTTYHTRAGDTTTRPVRVAIETGQIYE